ncbi:MAG TPA: sensor histidine kinase [Nocardioides sp.]|nr:sensor histidine kinase [Nocardioides sp.]
MGLSEDLTRQPPVEPFLVMVVAGRPPGDALPSIVFWAAAFGIGATVRRFRTSAEAAVASARKLERRRDADVRDALAAERSRIARELHDVVAHSLSVMVVQASVEARLRGDQDPALAATLATIEDAGRAALDDLRRLLGLLRAEAAGTGSLEPLPTLADLDAAVGRLRAAGLEVTLTVVGEDRSLPPGVTLSAYRIAQEAMTNAMKHAPGSAVRVEIRYDAGTVTVTVDDDGPQPGRPTPDRLPGGHGLIGMRERVRLYSGTFEAGPRPHGGYGVRALLPARAEA